MTKEGGFSRRKLLKIGGMSALAIGASGALANNINALCEETPKQPEGPFYPVRDQADKNNDLTIVTGKTELALGNFIYLTGKVLDQDCATVPNCIVEIWQACESGRYNHPGDDENNSPLDPNFQYWGITVTDNQGRYSFKTILPGHYSAGPNWIRPPHIHFKIHKRGIRELITQMYFAGNPLNEKDLILERVPRNEWDSVVRPTIPRASENRRAAFDVVFDINVERLV